jgi:hypothetical protein
MSEESEWPGLDRQRAFAAELINAESGRPVRIRFFAEVGADFALWDPNNTYVGELEDRLPMSPDLSARIKDWAIRHYRHDGGERRMSESEFHAFVDEGRALSEELQAELGPEFNVVHHP